MGSQENVFKVFDDSDWATFGGVECIPEFEPMVGHGDVVFDREEGYTETVAVAVTVRYRVGRLERCVRVVSNDWEREACFSTIEDAMEFGGLVVDGKLAKSTIEALSDRIR